MSELSSMDVPETMVVVFLECLSLINSVAKTSNLLVLHFITFQNPFPFVPLSVPKC
jgi:hypothetical protein